jgi:hypothetical protein
LKIATNFQVLGTISIQLPRQYLGPGTKVGAYA